MQSLKITSNDKRKSLSIKVVFVLFIIIGAVYALSKIEFPAPNKEIEKIIPNEKLKIVK